MASSTPVTVTVCGTFQSAGVNVRLARATLPSAGLPLARANATSAAGMLASRAVNVAVPPLSVVVRPAAGANSTPTTSLSWFVTLTSAGSSAS